MGQLDGVVALVTGAAGGIGRAVVAQFAAEGARVLAGDRAPFPDLDGPNVASVRLDVTDQSSWAGAVAAATERFGAPTVLVNNAGIDDKGAITEQEPEAFLTLLRINLVGPWLGLRAVVPGMRAAGRGAVVNVCSAAAFGGTYVAPGLGAYISSKWGLRGLTKAAALELGADGIRVNAIHPGVVDTPMARDLIGLPVFGANAVKRAGMPDEIARLAVFLASEQSSYCTGADFVADGGLTAGRAR